MDNKDLLLGENNEIGSNENDATIPNDRSGRDSERGSSLNSNNFGSEVYGSTEQLENEQQSQRETIGSSNSHSSEMDLSSTNKNEAIGSEQSNDNFNGVIGTGTERGSSLTQNSGNDTPITSGTTRDRWDQYTNNSVLNDFDFSSVNIPTGKNERWAANIAALSLLKKYDGSSYLYSASEKEILAKFTGWGALSSLISDNKDELLNIVGKEEFGQIQRSSLDSYYTSDKIVKGIWNGLSHLGVLNDNDRINILEPSSGTGNFIKHAPSKIKNETNIVAVELDKTSADIFDGLFPASTTINKPFEETGLLSNSFDLVVANPPYGDHRIYDPQSKYSSKTIANYFVGESLEKLRNGGIGVYVVSSRFLDSHGKIAEVTKDRPDPVPSDHDKGIRGLIGENASFLGAVRLPSNAFSHTDTSVVTDVIFFKKGTPDFSDNFTQAVNKRWINTEKIHLATKEFKDSKDTEIRINEYFVKNPQNILGNSYVKKDQFGKLVFDCESDGRDLEKAISDFVKTEISPNLYVNKSEVKQEKDKNINIFNLQDLPTALAEIPINTFYTDKDNAYVRESNAIVDGVDCAVIRTIPLSKTLLKRATDYCLVRDSLNNLLNLEKTLDNSDHSIFKLNTARQNLNKTYDSYVEKHGLLNSTRATSEIRKNCKEFFKVRALEVNYLPALNEKQAKKGGTVPRSESAGKADVFKKRTHHNVNEVLNISSYKDAHIASLNKYGKVDINYITSFFPNENKDEIINSLLNDKLIFPNIDDKENAEPFITKEKLLFGNVLTKLEKYSSQFNTLNDQNEFNIYKHAVDILNENQPDPISAADISVNMGAPYIGNHIVNQFFRENLGQRYTEFNTEYHEETGSWFVKADTGFFKDADVRNSEGFLENVYNKYFTPEIHPKTLLTCILHQKPIMAFKNHKNEDGSTYKEFLPEQTHIANMKATKLKEDFKKWLFQSQDRRREIEEKYNKTYNTSAKNVFDGSHLTLHGLNEKIILRPHQKNAIWRAVQQGNTLFDHTVGAGKTYATIASIMEMKRMGLKNKPLVIVPNNLLYQWAADWKKAYPSANILVPSPDDMTKNNREHFFGKIALNDYDAVLMTHSQFTHIDAPIETQRKLLEKELDLIESLHYVEQSVMERNENQKRAAEKALIKRKDTVSRKLKELDDIYSASDVFDFGDLGIDFLAVDELHMYKNLFITTKMQGIAGLGNLNGSGKAFDLYAKVQYLQDTYDGKGLLGATGTPISNTIAEMYTLQRYFQRDELAEKNIGSFDAWAATFGQTVSSWELDASGVNYKITNRFSKFQNVPELQQMYQQFADIINNDDIKKLDPDFVPKLEGGKPKNIVAERSYDVAKYIGIYDEATKSYNVGSIIHRMNNPHEDIRKNNMLACTTDARKAGLTYKLIDPSAEEDKGSKLHLVAQHAFEVYENSNSVKGTQLIFCDLSVPKTHSQNSDDEIKEEIIFVEAGNEEKNIKVNAPTLPTEEDEDSNIQFGSDDYLVMEEEVAINYDVYNDVLNKLVDLGVPRNEIAFIHDAHTDALKAELFARVNSGEVRILLGSTAKMGAGTNVQERIVAVHHLDCPWRPSDLEQRNGRAIRQGNVLFEADKKNFRIQEYRYATAGTYDSRMWQVQESKSIGLESFRSASKSKNRVIDDCSMDSANAAEMKALASGNPLILMEVQIKQEKMKYDALYSDHNSRKYKLEDQLRKYSKAELVISNLESNLALAEPFLPSKEKSKTHHYTGYDLQNETEAEAPNRIIETKNAAGEYIKHSVHPHSKSKENADALNEVLKGFKEFATTTVSSEQLSKSFDRYIKYNGLYVDLEKFTKDAHGVMTVIANLSDENGRRITTPTHNILIRMRPNEDGKLEFKPTTLFNSIDKYLHEYRENIQSRIITERNNIDRRAELQLQINQPFEFEDIYNALIEDDLTVISELNKQSTDNDYVSDFTPKYEQFISSKKENDASIDGSDKQVEEEKDDQKMTLDYFRGLSVLVEEKAKKDAEKAAEEEAEEEIRSNTYESSLSGQNNAIEISDPLVAENMVKDYPATAAQEIKNTFEAKAIAKGFSNNFVKEKVSFVNIGNKTQPKSTENKSTKSSGLLKSLKGDISNYTTYVTDYFKIWKNSNKDEIKESIKNDDAHTSFVRLNSFIDHYNETFGQKQPPIAKDVIEAFYENGLEVFSNTNFSDDDKFNTKGKLKNVLDESAEIVRDFQVDLRLKSSKEQSDLEPMFDYYTEQGKEPSGKSIYNESLQLSVDRLRGILNEVKHNETGIPENIRYFQSVQKRSSVVMGQWSGYFQTIDNDDPEKIAYKNTRDKIFKYTQEIKSEQYEREKTETKESAEQQNNNFVERLSSINDELKNIIHDYFSVGDIAEPESILKLKEDLDNINKETREINKSPDLSEINREVSYNYMTIRELVNIKSYDDNQGQLIGVISNESIEATRLRMDTIEGFINSSESFKEEYPYSVDMILSMSAIASNKFDKESKQNLKQLTDLIKLKSKDSEREVTYNENGTLDIFDQPVEEDAIEVINSNEDLEKESVTTESIVEKQIESLVTMGSLINGLSIDRVIEYISENSNESQPQQENSLSSLSTLIEINKIFKENKEENGNLNIKKVAEQLKSDPKLEKAVLENINSSVGNRGLVGYESKILYQMIDKCNTHISAKTCSSIVRQLSENDLVTLPTHKLIKHGAMRNCYSLGQSENPMSFKHDLKRESYDQISERVSWVIKEMEDTRNISQPFILSMIETELYSSISVKPSEDGRLDYSDSNNEYDFVDPSKGSKEERSSVLNLLKEANKLRDSIHKFEIEKHGNGSISEYYKNMPKEKYFYTCMSRMNDINNDIKYHQTFDKSLLQELRAIEASTRVRTDTPLNKMIQSNAEQLVGAYKFNKPKSEKELRLAKIGDEDSTAHYKEKEKFNTMPLEELTVRVNSLIWELNIDNTIHEVKVIDAFNLEISQRLEDSNLSEQDKLELEKMKDTISVVAKEVNHSIVEKENIISEQEVLSQKPNLEPVKDLTNESIKASNHRLTILENEVEISGSLKNPNVIVEITNNVNRLAREEDNSDNLSEDNLSKISEAYSKIDNIIKKTTGGIDYAELSANISSQKPLIIEDNLSIDEAINESIERTHDISEKISKNEIENPTLKSSSYEEEILEEVKENLGLNILSTFENVDNSLEAIMSNNFVVLLDLPKDSHDLKPLEQFSIINTEFELSKKLLNTEKLINNLAKNGMIEEFQQLVIENELSSQFNKFQNMIDSIKVNKDFTTISTKEELKTFVEIDSGVVAEKLSSYIQLKNNVNSSLSSVSAERTNKSLENISTVFSSLKDIRDTSIHKSDIENDKKLSAVKDERKNQEKTLKPKEERFMTMKMCFNTAPNSFTDKTNSEDQRRLLGYLWKTNGFNANNLGTLVKEFQEFAKIHNNGKYPKILNPNLEKYDLNNILKKENATKESSNNNIVKNQQNFKPKM